MRKIESLELTVACLKSQAAPDQARITEINGKLEEMKKAMFPRYLERPFHFQNHEKLIQDGKISPRTHFPEGNVELVTATATEEAAEGKSQPKGNGRETFSTQNDRAALQGVLDFIELPPGAEGRTVKVTSSTSIRPLNALTDGNAIYFKIDSDKGKYRQVAFETTSGLDSTSVQKPTQIVVQKEVVPAHKELVRYDENEVAVVHRIDRRPRIIQNYFGSQNGAITYYEDTPVYKSVPASTISTTNVVFKQSWITTRNTEIIPPEIVEKIVLAPKDEELKALKDREIQTLQVH